MSLRTRSLSIDDLAEHFTDLVAALSTPTPVREDVSVDVLKEVCANTCYHVVKYVGSGAQGTVYLARREGADGFHSTIAIKFYFRSSRRPPQEYETEMRRIARQAQRVSELQHDNLVDIRDFIPLGESRAMIMEWIDGIDLDRLLDPRRFTRLAAKVTPTQWAHLNDVIVTQGVERCALKPGVAIAIVQQCLAGLAALHEHGVVHCDVKPSNIMIKRTGTVKLVDMDSSTHYEDGARYTRLTPYFMAPELFHSRCATYQADIASLGYTLLELLTGRVLFSSCRTVRDLECAKRGLPDRLDEILAPHLRRDPHLVELCRRMIAVDPKRRFVDAEEANFDSNGAASFLRHLVKSDLWAEYDREIGGWLELVLDDPADDAATPDHLVSSTGAAFPRLTPEVDAAAAAPLGEAAAP